MTHVANFGFKKICWGDLDVMWCIFIFMDVKEIYRIKEVNTSRISNKDIYLDIPNIVWYDIV